MRVTAYVLVLGVFRDVPKRILVAGWVRLETDNEFEATIGPCGTSGTTEGGFWSRLWTYVRQRQGFRFFDSLVRDQEVEASNPFAPTTSLLFSSHYRLNFSVAFKYL